MRLDKFRALSVGTILLVGAEVGGADEEEGTEGGDVPAPSRFSLRRRSLGKEGFGGGVGLGFF